MNTEELYSLLLPAQFIFGLLTLVSLFLIEAPYGRFVRKGWGASIKAIYGWVIMETPAVIIMAYWFFQGSIDVVSVVMIIIWQSHYLRRTFHYPINMKGKDKPFPVVLVLMAISFNSMNGFINGYYLFGAHTFESSWLYSPQFIIGLVIFYSGYWINSSSDNILSSLQRGPNNEYVIPQGGLFKWVSNPHYFGEIIQWTGWAILTWSWAGAAFAFYTFSNLAPRAISHHAWYKKSFKEYPNDRKALIPYLW